MSRRRAVIRIVVGRCRGGMRGEFWGLGWGFGGAGADLISRDEVGGGDAIFFSWSGVGGGLMDMLWPVAYSEINGVENQQPHRRRDVHAARATAHVSRCKGEVRHPPPPPLLQLTPDSTDGIHY